MRISDWSSDVCSSDLEKQIVERRDPIEFIRRDTEIDRGRDAAKVRQGKVAFGRRAIDNWIDPELELGGDGMDNAGECVVGAGRKIAQSGAEHLRECTIASLLGEEYLHYLHLEDRKRV